MPMQAHDMPYSKLINVDQGAREHFHIPKYQREYAWNKNQWNQLLEDIGDNDSGYFMGSIICVNDTQSISAGDEIIFEVIDGQQRLTTLSLLLGAIHKKLSKAIFECKLQNSQDVEDAKSSLHNIKSK